MAGQSNHIPGISDPTPPRSLTIPSQACQLMSEGRYEGARGVLEGGLAETPGDPYLLFNTACADALSGDTPTALKRLQAAVRNGYSDLHTLQNEADLRSLRGLPAFSAILESVREHSGGPTPTNTSAPNIRTQPTRPQDSLSALPSSQSQQGQESTPQHSSSLPHSHPQPLDFGTPTSWKAGGQTPTSMPPPDQGQSMNTTGSGTPQHAPYAPHHQTLPQSPQGYHPPPRNNSASDSERAPRGVAIPRSGSRSSTQSDIGRRTPSSSGEDDLAGLGERSSNEPRPSASTPPPPHPNPAPSPKFPAARSHSWVPPAFAPQHKGRGRGGAAKSPPGAAVGGGSAQKPHPQPHPQPQPQPQHQQHQDAPPLPATSTSAKELLRLVGVERAILQAEQEAFEEQRRRHFEENESERRLIEEERRAAAKSLVEQRRMLATEKNCLLNLQEMGSQSAPLPQSPKGPPGDLGGAPRAAGPGPVPSTAPLLTMDTHFLRLDCRGHSLHRLPGEVYGLVTSGLAGHAPRDGEGKPGRTPHPTYGPSNSGGAGEGELGGRVLSYLKHTFLNGSFRHSDPQRLGGWILGLCQQLLQTGGVLERHGKGCLVRIPQPCWVLGDLHGNYQDLEGFMGHLMQFGSPHFSGHNWVFLGDYVDRGDWSVEVVAYLFALKLVAPSQVVLLRGNHETHEVNGDIDTYGSKSFKAQCLASFGEDLGNEVWVNCNFAFAKLPLACVVGGRAFCVHGGIPRHGKSLQGPPHTPNLPGRAPKDNWGQKADGPGGATPWEKVQLMEGEGFPRFNSVNTQPGENAQRALQRQIAMDVLWSDPSGPEQEADLDEYGFGPNHTRDPSNVVVFGERAVRDFLAEGDMDLIIRAHESVQGGVKFCQRGKVLTVFSSAPYSNRSNSAGGVFISQDGTIRFLSLSSQPAPVPPPRSTTAHPSSPPASPLDKPHGALGNSQFAAQPAPSVVTPATASPTTPPMGQGEGPPLGNTRQTYYSPRSLRRMDGETSLGAEDVSALGLSAVTGGAMDASDGRWSPPRHTNPPSPPPGQGAQPSFHQHVTHHSSTHQTHQSHQRVDVVDHPGQFTPPAARQPYHHGSLPYSTSRQPPLGAQHNSPRTPAAVPLHTSPSAPHLTTGYSNWK